jgi:hypothetical protein
MNTQDNEGPSSQGRTPPEQTIVTAGVFQGQKRRRGYKEESGSPPRVRDLPIYYGQSSEGQEQEQEQGQQEPITLGQFKDSLTDSLKDPILRRFGAAMEYEETRQGADERVEDFARRLDVLERELGHTDDRHRADTLFAKLRPELSRDLLFSSFLSSEPPTTRQEVLRLGRRMETMADISGPSREVAEAAPTGTYQGQGTWQKQVINQEIRPGACTPCGGIGHRARRCLEVICYKCGSKGHFARSCTKGQ